MHAELEVSREVIRDLNDQVRNLKWKLGQLSLQVSDQGMLLSTLRQESDRRKDRRERREARGPVGGAQMARRTGGGTNGKGMALMSCHGHREVVEEVGSSSVDT